ncbi:MAG: hypothetical protein CM1200mP35_08330 [Chloroflexota bacterium]|nr:MAG: hypothetical protein CM1200mP35_08330 [Chloroflexota bacterium]
MEMEYPLRMERYAIMPDSGGAGKFRGGCGVIREVRLLADTGTYGLRVENNIFSPHGEFPEEWAEELPVLPLTPELLMKPQSKVFQMIMCGKREIWCAFAPLGGEAGVIRSIESQTKC